MSGSNLGRWLQPLARGRPAPWQLGGSRPRVATARQADAAAARGPPAASADFVPMDGTSPGPSIACAPWRPTTRRRALAWACSRGTRCRRCGMALLEGTLAGPRRRHPPGVCASSPCMRRGLAHVFTLPGLLSIKKLRKPATKGGKKETRRRQMELSRANVEVKSSCVSTLPGLLSTKTRKKPATKAGKKETLTELSMAIAEVKTSRVITLPGLPSARTLKKPAIKIGKKETLTEMGKASAEVKTSCAITLPDLLPVNPQKKPATKAGKKETLGLLAELSAASAEVKKSGVITLPGHFLIKTSEKPALHKRMLMQCGL